MRRICQLNNICIHGRLTKNPDLSSYRNSKGSDNSLCRFSVAVNRNYGDDADFFNCTVFGKRAEVIDKYFSKGSEIIIRGRMESNKYKDKDGNNRIGWGIMVEAFDFCGSKKDGGMSRIDELRPDSFEEIDDDVPF